MTKLRRAVLLVGTLNFIYFFVEFGMAKKIASVALYADSIDFLEDAAVNFLVVLALGWSAKNRSIMGMAMAVLLLVPAIALVWTAYQKLHSPVAPEATLLSITGFGALLINVTCSFLLAKHRNDSGSLSRAAFYSARNDAIANLAIILAGFATRFWPSAWPDLMVGIGIGILNAGAAKEVWEAARSESLNASHSAS